MRRRTFLASLPSASPAAFLDEPADPGAPKAAIERWEGRRSGMSIHWGPVSIVGAEIGWSRVGPRPGGLIKPSHATRSR